MGEQIHIKQSTFGQLSNLADTLVIEICKSLVSFCELQSSQNKLLFICHYPIEHGVNEPLNESLINAIKHFQFSKKQYANVLINYFTSEFTLCPTAFYNNEYGRSLLEFNAGTVADNLIITDDLNTDIKLIYSINEHLKSTLDRIFPHHQLRHTLTVFSKLMLVSEEFAKEQVLIAIHLNHINVVVKQDHKLLLTNQYAAKTQEDILYYVLFILEQYQLNPSVVNVTLTGNIDSNSELIMTLKKYIKNVHLPLGHKTLNWADIAGSPQHHNYTLINRLFCE